MEAEIALDQWREMLLGFGGQVDRLVLGNEGIFLCGEERVAVA